MPADPLGDSERERKASAQLVGLNRGTKYAIGCFGLAVVLLIAAIFLGFWKLPKNPNELPSANQIGSPP